jgi:hypothetical protein
MPFDKIIYTNGKIRNRYLSIYMSLILKKDSPKSTEGKKNKYRTISTAYFFDSLNMERMPWAKINRKNICEKNIP